MMPKPAADIRYRHIRKHRVERSDDTFDAYRHRQFKSKAIVQVKCQKWLSGNDGEEAVKVAGGGGRRKKRNGCNGPEDQSSRVSEK